MGTGTHPRTARLASLVVAGFTVSAALAACAEEGGGTAARDAGTFEPSQAVPRVETVAAHVDAGSGGMDVDADGNVYMADFGYQLNQADGPSVWRVTPEGTLTEWATGLQGASGNDFDSRGSLIQSNIRGGSLSRIAPDGTVEELATGLRGPVGVQVVEGDTAYVVECGAGAIARVGPDGTVEPFVTDSLLRCPNGITRASDGNFYVANFYDGNVIRVTPDGVVERFVTLPGDNNGHVLWGNDRLYVVARTAGRIYQVTLDGDTTLLAGTGERGLDDGPALEATLSLTNDVALSPDGSMLYFNDVGRNAEGVFVADSGRTIGPVVVRRVVLR